MTGALERIGAALRDSHIDAGLVTPTAVRPLAEERARATRSGTLEDYAALLERSPEERSRLRELVTVPETWLFRYPAAFELLRERLAARGPRPFRALSVACATGAEPAAIAITALAAGVPAARVEVHGVDPNPTALARARAGRWSRMAVREALPDWAAPWIDASGDEVVLRPEVLPCLRFEEGLAPEALAPFAARSFDAVWCRNLAIYLSQPARRTIGARLVELLAPDGLLFLGHAEPPGVFGLADEVASAGPEAAFAFRRAERHDALPAAAPAARPLRAPAARRAAPATARPAPRPPAPGPTVAEARRAADLGRLDDAMAMAGDLHRGGDRSIGLLELLGALHAAKGDVAGAEQYLRQVIYLDPDHAEALLHLALLAERRGDAGLAQRYRTRAAKEAG